jgi:hypothetical protein
VTLTPTLGDYPAAGSMRPRPSAAQLQQRINTALTIISTQMYGPVADQLTAILTSGQPTTGGAL